MSSFKDNPYRHLIYGVTSQIPSNTNNFIHEINFDNAATTPPFKAVVNDIINFSAYYSSIHRGEGYKSRYSTHMYDTSRLVVKEFIKDSKDEYDVIYVKNCTEAINKLSELWAKDHSGSIILSTFMEHHSNDLPWRKNFQVKYTNVDENGCLDLVDLKNKLTFYSSKISLVAYPEHLRK